MRGVIRMSFGPSEAIEARTFWSMRILIIWSVMPNAVASRSSSESGVPTFTAMMMSAPMRRAMSMGRLLTSPPSTNSLVSTRSGANNPGTDIDARTADTRGAEPISTSVPDFRSVATALKGTGRPCPGRSSAPSGSNRSSVASSTWLPAAALGRRRREPCSPTCRRDGT